MDTVAQELLDSKMTRLSNDFGTVTQGLRKNSATPIEPNFPLKILLNLNKATQLSDIHFHEFMKLLRPRRRQ